MQLTPEAFRVALGVDHSPSTAQKYASASAAFLDWLATQRTDLTRAPIQTFATYCRWLVEQGYRPATVELYLTAVARYVAWRRAQGETLPQFSPPELPRREALAAEPLSADELVRYFQFAAELSEPMRTAVMLLPCTGMSCRALVSLPLPGVPRRVPLELTDGKVRNAVAFVTKGKNGQERLVVLSKVGGPQFLGFLAGWRCKHRDLNWMFPGIKNHAAERTLRAALQHVRERMGATFNQQTLRATYFMTQLGEGVPLATLAKTADLQTVKLLKEWQARHRPSSTAPAGL